MTASGGNDMTCPACGQPLKQVGSGLACDACGLYMGPGGTSGGVQRSGAEGGGGWYRDRLEKVICAPNPLFPQIATIQKGDRVGFKVAYGEDVGRMLIGTVASVDTDEATGSVHIVLENESITNLEG